MIEEKKMEKKTDIQTPPLILRRFFWKRIPGFFEFVKELLENHVLTYSQWAEELTSATGIFFSARIIERLVSREGITKCTSSSGWDVPHFHAKMREFQDFCDKRCQGCNKLFRLSVFFFRDNKGNDLVYHEMCQPCNLTYREKRKKSDKKGEWIYGTKELDDLKRNQEAREIELKRKHHEERTHLEREFAAEWEAQGGNLPIEQRRRESVLNHYGRVCALCGWDISSSLEIDHIHNNGNTHRREAGNNNKVLIDIIAANYPRDQYQILCSNCNRGKQMVGSEKKWIEILKKEGRFHPTPEKLKALQEAEGSDFDITLMPNIEKPIARKETETIKRLDEPLNPQWYDRDLWSTQGKIEQDTIEQDIIEPNIKEKEATKQKEEGALAPIHANQIL